MTGEHRGLGPSVSRETLETLDAFVSLLLDENQRQNLISPGSIEHLWDRHILDAAQLLSLAGGLGRWADIGSGPGLPGMVIAILGGTPMTLIEPRKLRADFLRRCIATVGIAQVDVTDKKVERVGGKFDIITARAVAKLDRLFEMAGHLAHDGTKWVLPKGQSVKSELDDARRTWQGDFRLVPSRTHPDAAIVVAEHVRRRGK